MDISNHKLASFGLSRFTCLQSGWLCIEIGNTLGWVSVSTSARSHANVTPVHFIFAE